MDNQTLEERVGILEARLAERDEIEKRLDERMRERFANAEAVAASRFAELLQRFETITSRFNLIDQRFDLIDQRFDGVDKRFDGVDKRLDAVDRRIDGVDKRLDAVDGRLRTAEGRIQRIIAVGIVTAIILIPAIQFYLTS